MQKAPSDEGAAGATDWGRDVCGGVSPSDLCCAKATSLVRGRRWEHEGELGLCKFPSSGPSDHLLPRRRHNGFPVGEAVGGGSLV